MKLLGIVDCMSAQKQLEIAPNAQNKGIEDYGSEG
jgi:hypothetical protein